MDWSSCSETCGNGTQTRERECDGPYYNGLDCSGDTSETQNCFVVHCPGNVGGYNGRNQSNRFNVKIGLLVFESPVFGKDGLTTVFSKHRSLTHRKRLSSYWAIVYACVSEWKMGTPNTVHVLHVSGG